MGFAGFAVESQTARISLEIEGGLYDFVRRSVASAVLGAKGPTIPMNHPISRAFALAVALAASTPFAPAAHACGGYGAGSFDVAVVQREALGAARSMQARDRASALAAFAADATASHEYHGCCMPPTFSAGDWLTQRFADRTWQIGTLSTVTRSANTIVATFTAGTINTVPSTHQFTFTADRDGAWKISRVYTARATRQA